MGRTIAGAGLMALLSFGACGQSATVPAVFEVASVMPSKSGIRGSPADFSVGERFTATNMPLCGLILIAAFRQI